MIQLFIAAAMMRPICLLLILAYCLSLTEGNTVDIKITYDVLSHFQIRRCILLTNQLSSPATVERVKYLTKRNIMTVAMNLVDLTNYFYGNQLLLPSHREAVVGGLSMILASNIFVPAVYRPPHVMYFLWLVFPDGDALYYLSTLNVPYNCEYLICSPYDPNGDERFGLFEFYELKGVNQLFEFGNWSENQGLSVKKKELSFYRRRYDFKASTLVMLRMQESGYQYDSEYANVQLWLAMGEMMNFTTRMITQETKQREIDLIADVGSLSSAFHASVYKLYGIPMLAPIWRKRMFMYVRHEVDATSLWAAYIRPMSRWVWLCLSCTLLAASVCLVVIGYQIPRKIIPWPPVELGFTPLDSMCNQGGARIGSRMSKRIAVACIRLLAIAVMHAYAGVIISTLTLQYPSYPFNDLEGFANSGQYVMGSVTDTFGVGYFQYSSDPIANRIATSLFEPMDQLPFGKLEGLRRCCKRKYAFISDENVFYDIDQRQIPCRILRIPTPAFVTYAGMDLYQYSEYRRVLFYNLLYFYSNGILKKLGSKKQIAELELEEYEQVELSQVYSLLALLACGILAGIVVLLLELFFYRKFYTNGSKKRRLVMYDGLWRYVPSNE